MHPILYEFKPFHLGNTTLGPIKIHSFSVLLIVAFLASLWLARRRSAKYGFDAGKVSDASMVALFAGVLGARVVFIMQELPYYLAHRDQLFSLQFQGLTSFGGLLFGLGAYAWFALRQKRPLRDVLDVVAPSAMLGHAIGRIGCLLNGCCYGVACTDHSAFCVAADGTPFLHVPAQLYDSIMSFAALGVMLWIGRAKQLRSGQMFSLFLMLYGLTRFIYEFWRAGTVQEVNTGYASSTYWGSLPITQAQGAAIGMVLAGIWLYVVYQRQAVRREQVTPTEEAVPA